MKTSVIITAGGSGKRMGQPKQFLSILGRPMIEWTLDAFQNSEGIDEIIVVLPDEYASRLAHYPLRITRSGAERTDSVRNGLKLVSSDTDIVLIHDGARPLITPDIIEAAIAEAIKFGAVVVGVPAKDTIKEVTSNAECVIHKTLDRSILWQAQTPQAFKKDILLKAYANAKDNATDDSKLVEALGIKVKMVMGSYENIKVTTPEDLTVAEAIIKRRLNVSSE